MDFKYGSYGYEFEVMELNKDEGREWDSFVEQSPQGTVFHTTSWLAARANSYKIIVCRNKKSIVAGIPLTYSERFGRRIALNPPYTPYLGVIFRESTQKYNKKLSLEKELSKTMAKIVKDFASYVDYSFHHNFTDAMPFIRTGFSVRPRYTYLLNLEASLEAILENMEKDTRNMITRALKDNLDISDASPSEMAELIYLSYARKNQKTYYSKKDYEMFLNSFCKSCTTKTIMVKSKHEPLAAGTVVCDSKRAYYLLGGINPQGTYKGTNQLVVWLLIRYSKEILGLKEFDLLGAPDENIERFIRGFGGKLTPGYVIYKDNITYRMINSMHSLRAHIHIPYLV